MEHATGVWGALRDALNLSGVGALIAAIALLSKGKTDQKMISQQLQQKAAADERDDDRDDRRAQVDARRAAAEERQAAALRLDVSYAKMEALLASTERQRDFYIAELDRARGGLVEKRIRDEALAARGVTFEQAFVLVDEALAARRSGGPS